jgi:hypothetical protein
MPTERTSIIPENTCAVKERGRAAVLDSERSERDSVTRSILRDLGKSPARAGIPALPTTPEPRLRIDDDGNFIDEFGHVVDDRFSARRASASAPLSSEIEALIERTVERLYRRFGGELGNLVELQREIEGDDYVFCRTCSHDDCKHYHARRPYARVDVERYVPATKLTIYSWLHDGAMPRPISGPPYEWDPHAIACFKYDHVALPNGHYDRAEHLRLLKVTGLEREAKRKAKSAKLSAHMVRENARRRKAKRAAARKGGAR